MASSEHGRGADLINTGSNFFAGAGKATEITTIRTTALYYSPTIDEKHLTLRIQTGAVRVWPLKCAESCTEETGSTCADKCVFEVAQRDPGITEKGISRLLKEAITDLSALNEACMKKIYAWIQVNHDQAPETVARFQLV